MVEQPRATLVAGRSGVLVGLGYLVPGRRSACGRDRVRAGLIIDADEEPYCCCNSADVE